MNLTFCTTTDVNEPRVEYDPTLNVASLLIRDKHGFVLAHIMDRRPGAHRRFQRIAAIFHEAQISPEAEKNCGDSDVSMSR